MMVGFVVFVVCVAVLLIGGDVARTRKQMAEEQSPASIVEQHRAMSFGKEKPK